MQNEQIANLLRLTSTLNPKSAAAYEMAIAEVEAGAEQLKPETRQAFIASGTRPPRSVRGTKWLVSDVRAIVYNASTAQTLTANQNDLDEKLAALGI